jgi:glucokinase
MHHVLAIDIGGTKLAAGVVSDAGDVVASARRPTPATADPERLWGTLVEAADEALRAGPGPVVVGVGSGGPMTANGESLSPLHLPAWRDFPLRARLSAWSGLPTFVDNDAKALTLGEGWRGAARGERTYLGMVVSTGVGGGLVVDGRLLDGADGNAGHVGHVIVEPGGRPCACGATGCLEAYASGTALAARFGRPPAEAPQAVREETGRWVGRAVASVCNLLDLRLAVVAGSVALGFGEPFFRAAQAELDAACRLSFSRGARILPAGLGDAAPLVGAAAVGLVGLGRPVLGSGGG